MIGRCRCVDGATHLLVPSLYRGPIVSGTLLLVESLVRLGAEDAGEVLTLQRAAYVTEAQAHADLSSHRPATDSSTSPRTARRPDNDGLAVPRGVRLSPVIGLIIIIMRPAAAGRKDFS